MSSTATPYGMKPIGLLGGRNFPGANRKLALASAYTVTGGLGLYDPVKILSTGYISKDVGTTTLTPIGIFMGISYTDPNTKQLTFKQFYPAAGIVASDLFAYVADDPDLVFQMQCDGVVPLTGLGQNFAVNTTFTLTVTTTTSSTALTVTASGNSYTVLTQGVFPGMAITGTGIPASTTVVGVTGTTITMSAAATASASVTATVQGFNSIGNSMLSLKLASQATTSTLPIRVIDFVRAPFSAGPVPYNSDGVGNAPDSFTDCVCVWNWGTHVYRTATGI